MSQTPPNDKPMNEDEAWVSKQYQKAMREQQVSESQSSPSVAIDDAILAKAKQANIMQGVTQQGGTKQTSTQKKPYSWLRWQYGGSVAASVLILVFIYIGQHENMPEQAVLSNPTSPSSLMDTQEELLAPSPMQTRNSESKSMELVANEMDSLSSGMEAPIELSLTAQAKAVFTQMQSIRQADEIAARSAMAMRARAKKESQRRLVEKEKVSLKDSTENQETSSKQDASEVPQKVVNAENQTQANTKKPDSYIELQVTLFNILQKQKLTEEDWRLPEKYKAGLTEKQIAILLKEE